MSLHFVVIEPRKTPTAGAVPVHYTSEVPTSEARACGIPILISIITMRSIISCFVSVFFTVSDLEAGMSTTLRFHETVDVVIYRY